MKWASKTQTFWSDAGQLCQCLPQSSASGWLRYFSACTAVLTSSSVQSTNFPFLWKVLILSKHPDLVSAFALENVTCNTHLWRNSFLWLQVWTLQPYWCIPTMCLWMGLSYLNSQMHLNTYLFKISLFSWQDWTYLSVHSSNKYLLSGFQALYQWGYNNEENTHKHIHASWKAFY